MDKTTTSSLGFNKRRAEGGDKRDKHKTFQLKFQKLNQVNTISYVQVNQFMSTENLIICNLCIVFIYIISFSIVIFI